jgi:hypothetical protein
MRAKVQKLSMKISMPLIINLYTLIIKTGSFQGKNLEFGVFETMIFGFGTLKLGKLDF